MDFGCSTGYFGSLIKQAKNNQVYGVEISEDLHEARNVLDGVYSFDLDGEWPPEVYERKYDYLFFGDVLEHLKEPGLVLEKCKTLLKPNGLIFISTPNIAHISIRLELMGGNFDYEPMGILDNTHLKYFTKKSLEKMVSDAGYKTVSTNFTANDYPDSVINELLAKSGLQATDKFWKMVDSPEARAFQYKLVITPKESKYSSKVKKPVVNSQKPEQVRNASLNEAQERANNLEKHAKEQAKIIEHHLNTNKEQEHQIEGLKEENRILKQSTLVKIKNRLQRRSG